MTAKELHEQKIIPLRLQLQDLEREYRELYRKECGEKIGENASCKNCAMSCVISVDSYHNGCLGGNAPVVTVGASPGHPKMRYRNFCVKNITMTILCMVGLRIFSVMIS